MDVKFSMLQIHPAAFRRVITLLLLKLSDHQFEALNETGQRWLWYLTEVDLLDEIITKTNEQSIR
jgi:hypothetical protein